MKGPTPARQLKGFMEKYRPEIGRLARAVLARMRKRLPGAVELVYDNYNALVVGFGPTERASDAVFSIALYPRWVTLFFLNGALLADPARLLRGQGSRVRHMVLETAGVLDAPAVRRLMAEALKAGGWRKPGRRRLVIKSVSRRQRPRRPAP